MPADVSEKRLRQTSKHAEELETSQLGEKVRIPDADAILARSRCCQACRTCAFVSAVRPTQVRLQTGPLPGLEKPAIEGKTKQTAQQERRCVFLGSCRDSPAHVTLNRWSWESELRQTSFH